MNLFLLTSTALILSTSVASAQIQIQPIEVVEDAPLESFSERSGLWPSTSLRQDYLHPEGQTLGEFFNSVPGLQARETGSPTISIRGSAQADRILKMYEGVPLNLADGVGASNLFVPIESIGELRIFKGPASTFFGASAMGGAIDHRARRFERPALRLGLADDGGTVGTRNIFGVLPLNFGKSEGSPNAQITAFQEYRPGEFLYESVTGPQRGRRENNAAETTRVTVLGDFEAGSWKIRPHFLLARMRGTSPGSLQSPRVNTFDSKGSLLSVDGSTQLTKEIEASIRLADVRTWSVYDEGETSETDSTTSRSSLAADLGIRLNDNVLARSFLDFEVNSFKADYAGDNQFSKNNLELGQNYEVSLTPSLSLQPAFRFREGTKDITKAIGLMHLKEHDRAWLTYSEGFRAPQLSDLHSSTSFFKGNPDLKPERSQALEIGFLKETGRRFAGWLNGVSFGASAYYVQYQDLMEYLTLPSGIDTRVNSGAARSYGIESSLAYSVAAWTFSASHNWLNAKNENTGQTLRLSPEHQTTFSVSQQLGPAVFELRETIWSTYFDGVSVMRELPGWNSLDFNVRTIGLTDWEFKGGVTNLFNRPRELTVGYPEPQRRFYFSALRYL